MKSGYIYILTNKNKSVLYIGVTSDLVKRIYEHKNHIAKGFTEKYNLDYLVYYEQHHEITDAILREKQMKKWNREWKVRLIESLNPSWRDLYEEVCS